jgi:hypothetical protein
MIVAASVPILLDSAEDQQRTCREQQCCGGNNGTDELNGDSGDDFLHGGMDGKKDRLIGGIGKDTFIAEWWLERIIVDGVVIRKRYWNMDEPLDFRADTDRIIPKKPA